MGTHSLLVKAMRRMALWVALVLLAAGAQANTLLVMGDSLSAGYGMPPEATWVALMEERLNDRPGATRVINASISGETSMGGLERLPALLERHQPDIVLLELGANDGLRGFPVPTIQDNLAAMIELSQEAGADVILLGIRIPPNFGSRYTEPFFNQYAALAEQYDLPYLPFLLDGVAQFSDLMQADGLHPTASAQPIILENVWPLVENALRQRSP
ncbi:MAG: arylesterase [Saccharospirillum sp.]